MSGRDRGHTGTSAREDSCAELKFSAQLASPKEEVVVLMKVGDRLDIVVDQQHGLAVVYALWNGQVAGGVADQKLHRLRQCLGDGFMYAATVLSITNGQVRIQVFPANLH